jgi:N-methylhydantoinase B
MNDKFQVDPITLEIIRNALINITQEMKTTIRKTAYSSVVQEAQDFSVALFEKEDLIAQAEGVAAHLASLPYTIKIALQKFPIGEKLSQGDVIIVNDPYNGGSHLPDVRILKPVFFESLVFIPIVLAHWSDVGGMAPGSITGKATEVFQEGLRIPPIKIYDQGKYVESAHDLIMENVRLPKLSSGDLRAQISACNVAEDRLKTLVNNYGERIIKESIRQILNATEDRTRTRIAQIKNGIYEYEDYFDADGHTQEPLRIYVKITVNDDELIVDFEGTSKQAIGIGNTSYASCLSGVCIALKSMLDPDWPINQGFFRRISILAPKGTCVNPNPHAPTGACADVDTRIIDVIVGALCGALPEKVGAGAYGAINHTFVGGVHPETGKPYVWYEYPDGGLGATYRNDGCDTVHNLVGGDTKDFAIERAEAEFPLQCILYESRCDSGGPGKFRGGLGLRKDMLVLDDQRHQKIGLSCIWDRSKIPAYGMNGGFSGYPQRIVIIRKDGTEETIPIELGTKATLIPLNKEDIISMRTGGGGGYGDPLDRDPKLVLNDVIDGYVLEDTAEKIYGVAIEKNTLTIDYKSTDKLRNALRQDRMIIMSSTAKEIFIGERRTIKVAPSILEKIGLNDGGIIEILGNWLAPLRVWVISDQNSSDKSIGLDETIFRILHIKEGDFVWLRNPHWMNDKL